MKTGILRELGLSDNEIKIYVYLLKSSTVTAYDISQKTGIYRVHVYDKLEKLMDKGLVTSLYQGPKKFFQATAPEKIKHYIDEKKKKLEEQETAVNELIPDLEAMMAAPKEDTKIEIFRGKEGLKYFLKDVIKSKQEILILSIEEQKFEEAIPIFMKQYFRDLKKEKIKERVIAMKREGVFLFDKEAAPTTQYRFLEGEQFNPTNTMIYGKKVVLIICGNPITVVMIEHEGTARTYRNHFEQLWKIADKSFKK